VQRDRLQLPLSATRPPRRVPNSINFNFNFQSPPNHLARQNVRTSQGTITAAAILRQSQQLEFSSTLVDGSATCVLI